jgi:aromatic-L-amino-acid decarboxylase
MSQTSDQPNSDVTIGDMPVEQFRTYGHRAIDWVVDYMQKVDRYPVLPAVQPGDIRRKLPAAPPQDGEPMDQILGDVDRLIMPGITHWSHPKFFAYFNSSTSGPGILGELLGSALNVNGMVWESSPSASELEQVTLDWLRQMLGLPSDNWGIIYDTASTSTLHAVAAAREALSDLNIREQGMAGRRDLPRLRVYMSELAHSSVDKAVITLGFGTAGIRKIPADAEFRMQPQALADAIAEDRKNGIRPFCVVATIGTTSCTSIDPVPQIADICERERLWLHVDAAYGGAAAIAPEMRGLFDGWDRADSVVVNPHKWMFVPVDLSVLYTRRPAVLRHAFSLVPEYLRTEHDEEVQNLMDYGVPLGRRFRALKLWFVLRYFGWKGMADRIREHLRVAKTFTGWVDAHPDFERLAPVPLSTVCFRAHPRGMDDEMELNRLNEKLVLNINRSGSMFLSHTKLGERYTIRFVVSHLRVRESDVQQAWMIFQDQLQALLTNKGST